MESIRVIKIHGNGIEAHAAAGHFPLESQTHPAARRDLDNDLIARGRWSHFKLMEMPDELDRRLLELDHDLGALRSHALARAQVERRIGPPPVIKTKCKRRERFGCCIVGHAVGKVIRRFMLIGRILTQGCELMEPIDRRGLDRVDHLDLLLANVVRRKCRRRLHRHERQYLQQMRLDHVANRPNAIVVGGAMPDAQRFRRCDLHVIDVAMIPQRLEDRIGKTKHQQTLHNLLAQVVVDSIDRVFLEHAAQREIQPRSRLNIVAERLLDDDSLPRNVLTIDAAPFAALRHQARFADAFDDRLVQTWRDGKIKENVAAGLCSVGE